MSEEIIYEAGAIISPPDIRDYHLISQAVEFPKEFELTMPAVKNQGAVSSCVAHSVALVMEFYNKKQHGQDIPMSVGYIYGNRVSSSYQGKGMYTREAIKDACVEGNVSYQDFPFNEEVPKIFEMVEREKEQLAPKALPYRFTSYVKVNTEQEIKTALYNGYPVIFAIKWYKDAKVKNGVLTTNKEKESGAHCMVIYGWDERGWKFQNSWGPLWGNQGRAILPYNFQINQAFSIVDELVGDIEIKKPFKTKNALAKLLIKLINWFGILLYKIVYKIKH